MNKIRNGLAKIFTGREGFWPVFMITMLITCMPLVTANCIIGHDTVYHLLRIEALKKGIEQGLPFLRVNMLFLGGEGYASSLFYPDTLLYLPALMRTAGVDLNLSFHIFVAFTAAACFMSAYLCMKQITKDRLSALITAVIFSLCQYHLDDLYTRCAVGEYTAFIFVPMVILGIWDFMYDDCKRPYILGFGMIGVILCHTLTTIFCVGLCVCGALLRIVHLVKNPKIIIKLLVTAFAVLAMTAFYWMPVAEQLGDQTLKVTEELYDLNYEKLTFVNIFSNKFACLGLAPVIFLPTAIWVKRDKDTVRFADMCLILGLLFCFATTGLFPWARFSRYFKFIQFPWRLNVIASPLLAVAAGIYTSDLATSSGGKNEKIRQFTLFTVLAVMIALAVAALNRIDVKFYSYSNDYFDYAPFTEEVIGGEWLPVSVDNRSKLVKDAGLAYLEDGSKIEVKRDKNTLTVEGLTGNESYLDIPFIYYKGYKAVDTAGNAVVMLDGSGDNGRVRVYPKGAKSLKVYYNGTIVQKVSTAISVIMWLMAAAYLIHGFFRGERKARIRK